MIKDEILENALVKIESAANYLRGMAMFDKRLPEDIAKSVLKKVDELDEFTSKAVQEIEDNQ